jgi:hypothetical protein
MLSFREQVKLLQPPTQHRNIVTTTRTIAYLLGCRDELHSAEVVLAVQQRDDRRPSLHHPVHGLQFLSRVSVEKHSTDTRSGSQVLTTAQR